MTTLRVKGFGLPGGDPVDLYAVDGAWVAEPAGAVDVVAEGWILPGLVDAHTHPGADHPGDPLDEKLLRDNLEEHVDAGVVAIRAPGLAGTPPDWFGRDPELPRAVHAGPWLARPGHFLDGWGRRVEDADFPAVAREQAALTGWCKVIGDWGPELEIIPTDLLRRVVEAVHAVGGRVAVHSQHPDGGTAAVAAGVDSLEHGMGLDWSLLDQMRAQGTALVPTLSVICHSLEYQRRRPQSPRRDWYVAGAERQAGLVAAAHEAGVRLLAGTDSHPHGRIVDEIRALAAAGVPAEAAIAAASWSAREFLGFPGLALGALADAVVYDGDPRTDLDVLAHPRWVIARGRVLRPR